jgi:hypothetical protein
MTFSANQRWAVCGFLHHLDSQRQHEGLAEYMSNCARWRAQTISCHA